MSEPGPRSGTIRHLLVINYAMDEDDPVLAWQQRVVLELASRVERVTVVTERLGRTALPPNVRVLGLPHRPFRVPRRLGGGWLAGPRFLTQLRADPPDACFVHMASEWLYRLGWVLRRLRVPVVLWYAHGTVTRRLRLAVHFADLVVTSTPEGFRVETSKKRVIGQGIDVERFRRADAAADGHVVLSVGRLSPRKRVEALLDALAVVRSSPAGQALSLRLVGPPLNAADEAYARSLRARAERLGIADAVEWIGFVPHDALIDQYRNVFLHLNLSETGSMDKTIMESLAAGTPVLTSNPAFRALLADRPEMFLEQVSPALVAERILTLHGQRRAIDRESLRRLVVGRHDLTSYGDRVLEQVHAACAGRR